MKELKHIQKFNERNNTKVTKIGQKFTVTLPRDIMKNNFFKEGITYVCTNIIKFDELDNEIYVGENWISDSLTTVVN